MRVRKEGDQWHWVSVSQWAPVHAEIAKRLRDGDEEVIYIERTGSGESIRGAVKGN